jgi:hypothetical protein
MSDSAQESQKRHFSKIRPHVLDGSLLGGLSGHHGERPGSLEISEDA